MGVVKPHHHHIADESALPRLAELKRLLLGVSGINAKVANVVTAVLGSMPFFWFACCLALFSLPAVLTAVDVELNLGVGLRGLFPHWLIAVSIIALVAWIAQTFIQLVALPVLQVSGNAQGKALETNTKTLLDDGSATREHTEVIMDRLDLTTEGGLKDVLTAIEGLPGKITEARKSKH